MAVGPSINHVDTLRGAIRSIKASLRQDQLARLDEQLTAEQKKLSQQWISAECQEKFKMFCSRGGEW
ncbi:crotonobetainyl-CoA-hydratase [Culex quinquefasciatus]|uniref:Crotonobetainyl-CoA-hydratase n=1 Tax=Culex quinquefasciatus TaxID=7176 RepID=B0WMP1_CULQU|nr:crotonobetainyl-CoA-hydratase [Culex quinquefasciatus]|eukprot:XP_001849995.1 crotonobetainyl-CoA-hydratase [Culex quinquefasciatus]